MKVGKFVVCGIVALSVLALSTCATIITGSDQEITISSEPAGARVQIFDANNLPVWNSNTPSVAVLKKGSSYFESASYRVVIEKQGYQKQEFYISGKVNAGWYIVGNFFIGGLIGWLIVDPLTGAMWTLSPDTIYTNLNAQAMRPEKGSLMVVLKEEIGGDLFDELELVRVN